jgi:hypothetical protein
MSSRDWITERQAAHLAAFQEARRKTDQELAAELRALADECAERAADQADHDRALADLIQAETCRALSDRLASKEAGR